jgi:hypothetical protein
VGARLGIRQSLRHIHDRHRKINQSVFQFLRFHLVFQIKNPKSTIINRKSNSYRIAPLGQLPLLPFAIHPDHFRLPEHFGCLATGRQLVAQPEILEPFQKHQKSRPFPVRQTAELRQILSPTPTGLQRVHGHLEKKSERARQLKSVHLDSVHPYSVLGNLIPTDGIAP